MRVGGGGDPEGIAPHLTGAFRRTPPPISDPLRRARRVQVPGTTGDRVRDPFRGGHGRFDPEP